MQFTHSTLADMDLIFKLFEAAICYQKTRFHRYWQGFDQKLIQDEIAEGRHWKILMDGQLAAFFSVTYADPDIWEKRSQQPALYLHRIVTNPNFRGNRFMMPIIHWAQQHGRELGKQFIRMDTWADNTRLIEYYLNCGFTLMGFTAPEQTQELPAHYEGIRLSLFQLEIPQ